MFAPSDTHLAEAMLLRRQGRFAAAVAAAERVPAGDPHHAAARLLIFRILLEQGYIGRASRYAGELLRSPMHGEDGVRLRLWTTFFACTGLLSRVQASPDALDGELDAVSRDPGASPSLRALALDFRARTAAMRWIPAGGYPPHLRVPLADAFGAAARAYEEVGEPHEADGARRRAVDMLRHPVAGDPGRVAALLEAAVARTASAVDPLREGVARLAYAEAMLETRLGGGIKGADVTLELAAFDHAARCLEAGGHAYPKALVQCSLARRLLRYGVDEGVMLATGAARDLEAAEAITAARDLWVELVRWHKQHGQPTPEAEAMEAALRCAAVIDAPVGRALLDALAESAPAAHGNAGSAGRAALLTSADPPAWPELRELLRREQREAGGRRVVVAQWAVTAGRILLFGMRGDWDEPRMKRIEVDREMLDEFAGAHFRTPGGVRMLMADHGAAGEEYWARFALLVAPLAAWTDPDDVVCLVPHGPLHDLPLHVLPVDGVPLGLRNPVFYAPAAALLRHTLGRGDSPSGEAAAVFGDPAGDLPGARAEAAAVGEALGVAPRLGSQVTREAVLGALGTAGLLHFAGHADASAADGFDAGLSLAGGDVLRAREILSVRTRARLVVLGGCETGVSEHRAGDELAGLARALLVAGAGALLVSQWRVADASTEALLREVHRRAGEGAPLAEALRGAMAAVRAVNGWEHFHHWGGFVMIGQWR